MSDDVCGSTETTTGKPCQFSPGESCPWHNTDDPPKNGAKGLLDEAMLNLICGCLQNGHTISEACAEAGIGETTYYEWASRGRDENDTIYTDFAEETARARKVAARNDREELKKACRSEKDLRTWYKLHMNQYGDGYGDEDTDLREGTQIILHDDSKSYEQALNQ